jgi:hypothetical protein
VRKPQIGERRPTVLFLISAFSPSLAARAHLYELFANNKLSINAQLSSAARRGQF